MNVTSRHLKSNATVYESLGWFFTITQAESACFLNVL